MEPLYRVSYPVAEVSRAYPPTLRNRNKQIVYDIACPLGTVSDGTITAARWAALSLPARVPAIVPSCEVRADFFAYEPAQPDTVPWYLNFANVDMFAYYGGGLLAQDELQVAEHPCLASLRHALLHDNLSTLTVESGRPTPILIMGAQRRVSLATDPNAAEFRPSGLYGNAFGRAPEDAIRMAARRLDPPTNTNIIAMEAPASGAGEYTRDQIHFILATAYTGLQAARIESTVDGSPNIQVVIHTGFWGCGAYGGNRILMTALQILAARLSGIGRLVFHTGDRKGLAQFQDAQKLLSDLYSQTTTTDDLILRLYDRGYRWGTGDGN